jgi:NAD-reducing hydrogenase small subunit
MPKVRLATLWLEGCSGCHMSFLDLDEWLLDLASQVEVVYSPLVDVKVYPDQVDVALIEGGIGNQEQWELIQQVRERTRLLVAFGDCAITGNVPALRNPLGSALPVLQRSYVDTVDEGKGIPMAELPPLLDRVLPVHTVVAVEVYLPGCPPPADRIRAVLEALLSGAQPQLQDEQLKFG